MRTAYYLLSSTLSIFFLLSCGTDANNNDSDPDENDEDLIEFKLALNGITIKCTDANVGDMGVVDGVTYEAVNNDLLRRRIDSGSDVTKLCVTLVTDMNELFFNSRDFNQAIGNWDVSSVTTMYHMFWNSNFHQPIEDWDVHNVRDMTGMFLDTRFNYDISDWYVQNIETEPENFSVNSPLTPEHKPEWGTCPD